MSPHAGTSRYSVSSWLGAKGRRVSVAMPSSLETALDKEKYQHAGNEKGDVCHCCLGYDKKGSGNIGFFLLYRTKKSGCQVGMG